MTDVLIGEPMARKRHSPGQIARLLKQINADLASGSSHEQAAIRAGITEQTLRRWLRDYGSTGDSAATRLRRLQSENQQLKRAVLQLEQDKAILTEAVRGNF